MKGESGQTSQLMYGSTMLLCMPLGAGPTSQSVDVGQIIVIVCGRIDYWSARDTLDKVLLKIAAPPGTWRR
jgi:hypothetical protein